MAKDTNDTWNGFQRRSIVVTPQPWN
jgi:hypothetical protein